MRPICKGAQEHGSKRRKKANKVDNVQETYVLIRVKTIGHRREDRQERKSQKSKVPNGQTQESNKEPNLESLNTRVMKTIWHRRDKGHASN